MKISFFLYFIFIGLACQVANAQLLWYANPEKPQEANFYNLNTEPNEKGYLEVEEIPNHGKVWKVNKPSGSKRTELARSRPKNDTLNNAYTPTEGDIVYLGYQWKVKIAGNEPRKGFAVFQNKSQTGHSQNYPFNLDYDGIELSMNRYLPGEGSQKSRGKTIWTKAVKEEEWVSIIMGIGFSKDNNKGYIELWCNGEKQKLDGKLEKYIHRTLDDNGNYFKWGAYNENSRPFDITVWLDEMRVAKDFKTANPDNYK